MFSFFRSKSKPTVDLSAIGTDMHSHLLPGIDDGSPDTNTSLQLIKGLQELGLNKFITTPHILWDLYRNNSETIGEAQSQLKKAAGEEQLKLPLTAAAEYMMDDHFTSLLSRKEPLRTFGPNYVLVEFSFVSLPFEWKKILFDMQIQGYQPVLAHPERYSYMGTSIAPFREIADMGILLQVNLNSLTGYYGKPAQSLAQALIKNKLVSFVGTDCHHQRHLDAMGQSAQLMQNLQPLLDSGMLLNGRI
ncbi:tyrosine-protein phosphatase [Flavihumibacter profundi]|uniref:tyrosine-protein phosphatase n=1 Tax=Flavihumibacter profundi TaxID=2716883 RepID=UPI001CC6197F|nr:CpsB/CapC family capsule biosynthesis tyrosine phosphatase [Flavihumibacter profundi]MBZ5858013.1 histidinol phosphatase [Flavihumibacter profundi]